MKFLLPLLAIATVATAMAEVEYEIHAKYLCEIVGSDLSLVPAARKIENLGLPILITVSDEDGHPLTGAHVALKRIGPVGGYQEADVKSADSPRSDRSGNAVILYPNWVTHRPVQKQSSDSSGVESQVPRLHLLGAVTVVAEGYETAVLELEQATEAAKIPLSPDIVPRFTIVLRKKHPSVTN